MIQKLIQALRSGEYKQAQFSLRCEDSFCCMGVACDVYHKETGKGRWVGNCFTVGGIIRSLAMPEPVQDFFDFKSEDPDVCGKALSYLNDHDGKSFEEIADLLEKHYDSETH